MADQQKYLLTFEDESGKTVTEQVLGPPNATEAELQEVARIFLEQRAPAAAQRQTVLGAPIAIPTQEEAAKQIAATEAQTAAQKKAMGERGILQAFSQGFMAPRQEDPFGLQLPAEQRRMLPLIEIANLAREGVQSLGSGLAEAGGQAIYNLGFGRGYSPQRLGAELGEFAQVGGLALPNVPLRTQAATAEFALPSVRQALQTVRQAAINVPNVDRLTPAQRLLAAAERQNVRLMPADVGGPTTQRLTAGTQQMLTGTAPITEAAQQTVEDISMAAQRAADQTGTAGTAFEAGMRLKDAARAYSTTTAQRGGRLYDKVSNQAQGITFAPTNAIAEIDKKIAKLRLKNDPSDPLLRYFEEKKTQLSNPDGFVYDGIKGVLSDMKKDHRQRDDLMLRSSDAKMEIGDVVKSLEGDVTQTLVDAGKATAANTFKQANQYWRTRVETIDDALEPILGEKVTPEQVLSSINTMAKGGKGGVTRLSRVLNSLSDGDRADVRASIVDGLGRVDAEFNPNRFVKNWANMTPEAKQALFGKDKGLMRALDDIALLAGETKKSQRFANASQTAGALQTGAILSGSGLVTGGAATGQGALTAVGFATALTPLIVGRLSARALTSPALVRYLADAPKKVKNADQFRAGLLDIASKTPAISAELEAIANEMGGQ